MATKAEQFRAAVERSHSHREGRQAETARGVRAANRSTHTARKAVFKLEESVGHGRPSRKSTRKAANRIKPDSNLELRQQRGTHSPETRARRAAARRGGRTDEGVARRRAVR
jgi:hypothetical protein